MREKTIASNCAAQTLVIYSTILSRRTTFMTSTTLTVQVDTSVNDRLERLAKSTGRSRDVVAAELINDSLDVYEWQVEGIQHAISSLDRGEGIPHDEVRDWIASWGSPTEKPVPGSKARTISKEP
jgi:RHH-type rel operon transcriptional repressor/antitoxin RelB